MDTFSLSNTLSKGSVYESDSIYKAYRDDAMSRLADGARPEAITNEQIRRGDEILETYRVEDDAIHGGMGSVWRVRHQSWNTDLAMKRPQPRFFSEGSERRKEAFIAECEHWINLGLHPNIVSCYYVREIGGVPTIFSEWMDGGSLKDAIQSGRLYGGAEEEVQARILDIAIQAARGLHYSHEQGLIHQDVKPGNILLSKDWDAKVADFGLAKARSQLSGGGQAASTGYTLQYCPKEQAGGAPAEGWMDVYAWALTVLEMYAGKRSWQSGAEAGDSVDALMKACRVPIPGEMKTVLSGAVNRADSAFTRIMERLEQIYARVCGNGYARPDPEAARDIADSMNNRALSFIELGQRERALETLEDAVLQDGTNARCQYNRALLRWNMNLTSYEELARIAKEHDDGSPEFAAVRACVENIARPASRNWKDERPDQTRVQEYARDVIEKTESGVAFEHGGKRHTVPGAVLFDISSDGRRALSGALDWHNTGYYVTELDADRPAYIARTWCTGRYWLHQPRFCDAKGTEITAQLIHEGIFIFEADTGRALKHIEGTQDPEGYDVEERITCFMSNGVLLAHTNANGTVPLPTPGVDEEPGYLLSKIRSYGEQANRQEALKKVSDAALEAFRQGRFDQTRQCLEPFVESKDIFLMPEALGLWGKLSRYYQKEKLLTVRPQQREGGEEYVPELAFSHPEALLPPGTKSKENCNAGENECYSVIISYDYRNYENYNGGFDIDSEWSMTAYDTASHSCIFDCCALSDSQTDETDWDRDLYVGFIDRAHMWYTKEHMQGYGTIDLRKRKPRFFLAGGGVVKNARDGLHIGELVFDDVYEGCESLLDADVLHGRKQDYRLIYTYGAQRADAARAAASDRAEETPTPEPEPAHEEPPAREGAASQIRDDRPGPLPAEAQQRQKMPGFFERLKSIFRGKK